MYSKEVLYNLPPDILYSRYRNYEIISGIRNGRIIYIDTHSKIYYDLAGQAIGKFRH
jgi:hypothetical protein